jgi:hypothetical protein
VHCADVKINICRTIILAVLLYGCETWSLTKRERLRPRVFENRVLRRIFGPKTEDWRRPHNYDLEAYVLYISAIIMQVIKSRMRWKRHVSRMGNRRGAYRVVVEKSQGRRLTWTTQA